MRTSENILLFDGVCNLCNGLVKFISKRDRKKKIGFNSLQSGNGESLLKKFKLDPADINSVVYIDNDKYYLKSAAILELFKDIGGGWRLLYGFIIIPEFIRDFFYDLLAKNRYKIFGRRNIC